MQIRNIIKCADLFLKAISDLNEVFYWGKKASGIIYVCLEDNTVLLLKRSRAVEQPGTWGVAGGAIGEGYHESQGDEDDPSNETFLNSAQREVEEELGSVPHVENTIGSTEYKDGSFTYKTFIYNITLKEKNRWTPTIRLNWENDDAKWFPIDRLPGGLHFGLQYTINQLAQQNVMFHDKESPDFVEEPAAYLPQDY